MSETIAESLPSRRLWGFAAAAAIAIHLGCVALAMAHMQSDESDEDLGAPAIEVGLDLSSPHREATDLPPGPDTDASVASPALAEQKAVVKETDLPKDTPTETEDPDRIVTENESKKPVDDDPEKAAVQTSASQESVAAEATAMPSVEHAPESERSVAPQQGTGASARRIRATWQKELVAHLDKHKRYPSERSLKSAEILVNFVLDRLGHVVSATVVKGSGDPIFDKAALAMVHRSDPVPPPPPLVADEGLSFTLPVVFRVKGKG
ncbi:outer membrane transport energization protein TonB [Nitrobacter hamburgensis X14]|uniref:Outer membrane transport energization protein TonB n=1 Tax=Nitrobacter hamburgensis (strain DSM 10229 / NCIMB 13809 / X14) TaxID=323097 RepID=Q1QN58_NITHX|nr:TonB family protein [Nitrobacter hamburgensis]ABE62339.1 outer membrane transport energization protein TonB [Nitrobacter hamburgensis X14]